MGAPNDTANPPRFVLTTAAVGDTTVALTVAGEIDIATVGRFETVLREVLARGGLSRLVLDFAALTLFDSSGISALHTARHVAQRLGVSLTVANCNEIVRRTLEITGLYQQLTSNGAAPQRATGPGLTMPSQRRLVAGGRLRSRARQAAASR
jgi:anti-anti-sigma factor